jgi:hypothetical protein
MSDKSRFTVIPENLYLVIQVPDDPQNEVRCARVDPFVNSSTTRMEQSNVWAYGNTININIDEKFDITVTHSNYIQKWPTVSHVNALSIFASNSQPRLIQNHETCNYQLLLEGALIVEKSTSIVNQSSLYNEVYKGLSNKLHYFRGSVSRVHQLLHVIEKPIIQLGADCIEESITDAGSLDFENDWPLINRRRIIPVVTVNNEKYILFKKTKVYAKRITISNGIVSYVSKDKL